MLVGNAILKVPLAHLCVMMHGAAWTLTLFLAGHCARINIFGTCTKRVQARRIDTSFLGAGYK